MQKKKVLIGNREIGDGNKCFLVAEAGTTCNGDLNIAKELVDAANEGEFDAIKFQTIWPDQISDKSVMYRYETIGGHIEENMYEMFKGLTFKLDDWQKLANFVRLKGLVFFSTVDSLTGVELLESCNVLFHKMGSWDVTYEPLITKIAKTGKPIMLDLGPATLTEIVRFVDLVKKHGRSEVILLHDFHTDRPEEMNMKNIPYLKKIMGIPVGFSAPGRMYDLDIMAVALGANVIEKRITLSRKMPGHHHLLSLEPDEFKPWVERIRFAESALGSEFIRPSEADLNDSKKYYRSICTTQPVKKGDIFSFKNIDGKRPGTGIPTHYMKIFLNKKATKNLAENTLLSWDDI